MSAKNLNNRQQVQPGLFEDKAASKSGRSMEYAVMHCDGASSGNPGDSGIGVVIELFCSEPPCGGETETYRISEYIGTATNNIAEYTALIKGLEKAISLGVANIKIFLDSELLVRQINGIYKVKNNNLRLLWTQVMNMLKEFDTYRVVHVRREHNKDADALATQGVRKKAGL